MRKLVCVLVGVLVCVSCFAVTDNSDVDRFQLFQGDDTGMGWSKPLTRGQAKAVLSRMGNLLDTKIETLDDILNKKIDTLGSSLVAAVNGYNEAVEAQLNAMDKKIADVSGQTNVLATSVKLKDKEQSEDIALANDKIAALQELIQKTRDQLAYLIRGTKEEIRDKAKSSADEEYAHPFYVTTEIGSIGTNGNKIEAGYDYKIFDVDYISTITPLVRYDNGLSFLVKGTLRFGVRR